MKAVFTIILISIGYGCLSQSKWVKAYYSCSLDLKQTLKGDSTITLNGDANSRLPLSLPDNLLFRTYVGTFEVTVNNSQANILLNDASESWRNSGQFADSIIYRDAKWHAYKNGVPDEISSEIMDIKHTGNTKLISGYDCYEINAFNSKGDLVMHLWVTDFLPGILTPVTGYSNLPGGLIEGTNFISGMHYQLTQILDTQ